MTVLGQKFLSVLCSSCIVFCTAASSFAVQAKCVRLPDELNMQCSGEECKAGILWKSSDDKTDGKYHPRIEWTGEVESNQFEVVVVDENGRQVSWPYPLGQGLFLSMKGNFLVEGAGGRADFSLSNPSHQYGYGPLATFATSHVRNATFDFHSSQGWYTLYIMNLSGEEFEGQMVPSIPRLWLTVRAVGENHGTSRLANQNAKDGIVCAGGAISLVSPCSIQVDPTTVTFENMRSVGAAKRLEQVASSRVTVKCNSGPKHNVYLRTWPAKVDAHNKEWARFKHKNGGADFKGLALIHKLNQRPANCDDGDIWGEAREFGKTKDSSVSGNIYWGLCRTESQTDVGDYSTTAVIYFWVD